MLQWYDEHRRDLPWRRTRDPYAILVSEVMLQQTQVDRVAPKYEEFLLRFPGFTELAKTPTAQVIRLWAPLGYNRRAVNLQRVAREVVAHYGGTLPEEMKQLRSLPGIGAYTAAALLCFAFGRDEAVVDTNVNRVLLRVEGIATASDTATRRIAADYLAHGHASEWNQALMDLGAAVCRAAVPACLLCPLRAECRSAGHVVREDRGPYRVAKQEPFTGSRRHLRGRIVEALRRAENGIEMGDLAANLGLIENHEERLTALVSALEADGLVQVEKETGRVRLPE